MFNCYDIRSFLQWQCHARTKQGHRVHSPFLYSLISGSLHKPIAPEKLAKVEQYRRELLSDKRMVDVTDLGSGSQFGNGGRRRICDIARHSSASARDGRLLCNLASSMHSRNFLELGTNLGIGSIYLSLADNCQSVVTIEGCPQLSRLAQSAFGSYGFGNIRQLNAEFSEVLPQVLAEMPSVDFVYFDGNHRRQPTIDYFCQCLPYVHNDTVFVFDDIHKNAEMEQAWNEVRGNGRVTLSLDFYTMGVLFFRHQLSHQTICLRY